MPAVKTLRIGDIRPFVVAFLAVMGVTVIMQYYPHFTQRSISAGLFLLLIVLLAERYGSVCAVFSAALTSAVWTWYFLPPEDVHLLDVDDSVLPVVAFFIIALCTAAITSRVRRQKIEAERREHEHKVLYQLTLGILAQPRLHDALDVLVSGLGAPSECVFLRLEGDDTLIGVAGGLVLTPAQLEHVRATLVGAHGPFLCADDAPVLCVPLRAGAELLGAMVLSDAMGRTANDPYLLALAGHAALVLHRNRLEHEAGEALGMLEAERLKASLLASVSHDLRTPLASIKAAASGIGLDDVEADKKTRRSAVSSIVANVDRLDRLVGNLLNMSRLEAGAWNPVKELFPFSEIVVGVLSRFDDRQASRILVDMPPDLPLVRIDGQQMEQVVWNLLENCFKYNPGDSPLLLRVRCEDARLEFHLRDRGAGIPKGEERRIFQKFYRAHRGGERGAPGVGMGLAICKQIVEAHGGEILAVNAPGGGALFTFVIPLEETETECRLTASAS